VNIGIIGGSGRFGSALATRFARAGFNVFLGGREKQKVEAKAKEIIEETGSSTVFGLENRKAVESAEIVILAIPGIGRTPLIKFLRKALINKIILDVSVPVFKENGLLKYSPPKEGSNAQETQRLIDKAYVVTGLHTVSANLIGKPGKLECDALIAGEDQQKKDKVRSLLRQIDINTIDAGPLEYAGVIEGLSLVVRYINKTYNVNNVGIKLYFP
jgi:NADPH-dependent F420 reductase